MKELAIVTVVISCLQKVGIFFILILDIFLGISKRNLESIEVKFKQTVNNFNIIERTPFVFTEEMVFVMGGRGSPDFAKFAYFCTQAYNLVRNKGNLLISLFIMMLAAGNFLDLKFSITL